MTERAMEVARDEALPYNMSLHGFHAGKVSSAMKTAPTLVTTLSQGPVHVGRRERWDEASAAL